jgi:sphingomyelin phosphodiesterase
MTKRKKVPTQTNKTKHFDHVTLLTLLLLLFLQLFANFATAQCNEQGCHDVELKIMSWNIYMLPHYWIHTGQLKRAKEIVEVLKKEDVDVIVFEEAFDRQSRKIIREGLKDYFPYESGDPRKNRIWKSNSGVWVLSKVPLTFIKQIFFKEAAGSDKFACKGAMLLRAVKDNVCFQIVGTHLQAELQKQNVQPIRKTQYEQIRKELLEPFVEENVPQFVVGDFNTMRSDSSSYLQMISSLQTTQCNMVGDRSYSFDYNDNDLIIGTLEKPQLIDYIMYKNTPGSEINGSMWVKVFTKKWNERHKDLSDHFAVTSVIEL